MAATCDAYITLLENRFACNPCRWFRKRRECEVDLLPIELASNGVGGKRKRNSRNLIEVPWRKTSSTQRREILVPDSAGLKKIRPIRSENRALLVASIARGRRWLNELITDPTANIESIAQRESCTPRNMTISLAFIAPILSGRPLTDGFLTEWA